MSSKCRESRVLTACWCPYWLFGSPAFVIAFVKDKTSAMVDDVRKLHVLFDPLTHTRLVRFCHNTLLSYLNRNLPTEVMRKPRCGLQTVNQAISMKVLRRGTDLGLPDATVKNTARLRMSATGTNALCSSHTT